MMCDNIDEWKFAKIMIIQLKIVANNSGRLNSGYTITRVLSINLPCLGLGHTLTQPVYMRKLTR